MTKTQREKRERRSLGTSLLCVLAGAAAVLALAGGAMAQGARAQKPVKVAAVDFVPAWGDLEGNVAHLAKAAEEVARQGVDYAVFPETAVSGYLFSGSPQIAPFLDTIPGRTTAALLPILQRTGLHMSVGIAERDAATGLAYNTAVLMGPTGTPTEIHADTTVALVGGGLGNAVLFSIGAATRAAGSKVIYFAGYKALRDRYKVEEIERAADVIVWCCDEAPGFTPTRPQDRTFVGNIVQAMAAYGSGALGEQGVPLAAAEHMIVIGSDRMMQAVGAARHGVLSPYLKAGHSAIGSINSPMQCMMKEVCAQCLQPQTDPVTGVRSVVFSCFNQDQALDRVDFPALNERLRQNQIAEKLTAQWIDRALHLLGARKVAA